MIDFKTFPTTRYQGSKRKALPMLYRTFLGLEFDTVLDACGGTGTVSYLLKKMGKSVTYNDKLRFNYLIGKAIIENSHTKLTANDINNLNHVNNRVTYSNLITTVFDDIYFLDEENVWLDMMVTNILNMNHYRPEILEYKKALAYYALFQSSMIKRPFNLFHRKNLDIRTKVVDRNFGNKTTWEKSFEDFFAKFATEANSLIFDNDLPCTALNESILTMEPGGYDLVYIDPPYIRKEGSNESSNYLRCYHFLEGLSRYEEWRDLIDFNSLNLRLRDIEEQNDFNKQSIYQTIEEIIIKFRHSIIVFSYKKGGLPSIDFIVKCMKRLGKDVRTTSMHYTYALNHQNGDAAKNKEVLIIGT